jgi:hypothetical protein
LLEFIMKKLLLSAAVSAILLSAIPAHAGFATGILRGMAMGEAVNSTEPVHVIIQNSEPKPGPASARERTIIAILPDEDKVTVHCRYSDGSVKSVPVSKECPPAEPKW